MKPKLCSTAAIHVWHQDSILLVHHKKSGLWLPPGGHIEKDELPHQAAVRECQEETGVLAEIVSALGSLKQPVESHNLPVPFNCNLHWISQQNYNARRKGSAGDAVWSRGCEQHLSFVFLGVCGTDRVQPNLDEVVEARFVSLEEVPKLVRRDDLGSEIVKGKELLENLVSRGVSAVVYSSGYVT